MSNIFQGYSSQDPNKEWNSFSTPSKRTNNNDTRLFYKGSKFAYFEDGTRTDHYQSNQASQNNNDTTKVKKLLLQQNKSYF